MKIFYDAACRQGGCEERVGKAEGRREGRRKGGREPGRRGYFQRLCPATPRKYSGAKYVNERNTSCKSEGTSKAKASYLQLDIVPGGTKKEHAGVGSPARKREEGQGGGAGKLSRSF